MLFHSYKFYELLFQSRGPGGAVHIFIFRSLGLRHRRLLKLLSDQTSQKKWQPESGGNPYLANCLPSCRILACVGSLSKASAKNSSAPLSPV